MKAALLITTLLLLASCTLPTNMQETIVLETSKGDIELQLLPEAAPNTAQNFKEYVESGFYDQTVFHRVIDGFMVQGGGFTEAGQQKQTREPIALEASHPNIRATVAMARTNDPNSATAQFFINVVDNDFLNPGVQGPGYTVFAEVVSGMDVVDEIASTQTTTKHGMQDWPQEEIVIQRAYLK